MVFAYFTPITRLLGGSMIGKLKEGISESIVASSVAVDRQQLQYLSINYLPEQTHALFLLLIPECS